MNEVKKSLEKFTKECLDQAYALGANSEEGKKYAKEGFEGVKLCIQMDENERAKAEKDKKEESDKKTRKLEWVKTAANIIGPVAKAGLFVYVTAVVLTFEKDGILVTSPGKALSRGFTLKL